jgi:hypothetical protein
MSNYSMGQRLKFKRRKHTRFFYFSDLVVQVVVSESITKHTHAHTQHTKHTPLSCTLDLEPCTIIYIRLQYIYEDKASLATGASPLHVIHRRLRSL